MMKNSVLFPNLQKLQRVQKKILSLPKDIMEWIRKARPKVEGKPRSFLACPFWEQIYHDESKNIIILGGRQIFKSTYLTDILAFMATTRPNSTIVFVTHDNINRRGFANNKFRRGCIESNPLLKKMVRGYERGTIGSIDEIIFKNGSTIYFVTDEGGFIQVEGKSPDVIVLDECQYQDLEFWYKLNEARATTRGSIKFIGIGGEGGSQLEDIWLSSDRKEWTSDDPNWRDKLRFDIHGDLIIGKYLTKVLKGKWVAKNPEANPLVT